MGQVVELPRRRRSPSCRKWESHPTPTPAEPGAAHPGVPHPGRGRAADRGRRRLRTPRATRSDPAAPDVPARPAGLGGRLLRWEQVDLKAGLLHVNRLKNGVPSTHPLRGPELRALRQLRREWPDSPYLFASERGGPMTTSNVRKLVTRAGQAAGLPFPHTHTCSATPAGSSSRTTGTTPACSTTSGTRNRHTVRYTELAPDRFKTFWRD